MGEVATDLPPVRIVSATEEITLIARYRGNEYGIKISRRGAISGGPWEWIAWPMYGVRGPHGETVGIMDDALTAAREAIVRTYS